MFFNNKTMSKKNKIIYAIKISELISTGLKVSNIKIGISHDIQSTLLQYKRSNPKAMILNIWETNPSIKNPYECGKGIHILAEKHTHEKRKETFIFLQESYQNFAKNVNLLLKNINI